MFSIFVFLFKVFLVMLFFAVCRELDKTKLVQDINNYRFNWWQSILFIIGFPLTLGLIVFLGGG